MKHLFFILVTLVILKDVSSAQELGAIKSIEVNGAHLELIPVGSHGFLMFEYRAQNLEQDQIGLVIYCYDHQLEQVWERMLPITKGKQLRFYQESDGKFFMIFNDPNYQLMEIFRVDLMDGQAYKFDYEFSNPFFVEQILSHEDRIWLTGRMLEHGVLFELDFNSKSYQTLPTAYTQLVLSVQQLYYQPDHHALTYLLKTSISKQQTFIVRSFDVVENKVVLDVALDVPRGIQLDQVRLLNQDQKWYITGTYFKKNLEQTSGIFQYTIEHGELVYEDFKLFREVPGFSNYLSIATDKRELRTVRKGPIQAQMDQLVLDDNVFMVSIESIEKQFEAKGALRQEFDKSYMENYLDQNQFGRRSFNQGNSYDGDIQSANDRIYQGSATDILKHRYSNAIVSQPIFQGYGYQRSIVFQFKERLAGISCIGIQPSNLQVNFMNTQNTFQTREGVRQVYDSGGNIDTWLYNQKSNEVSNFETTSYLNGAGRLFHLHDNLYLGAGVAKDKDQFRLNLQKVIL